MRSERRIRVATVVALAICMLLSGCAMQLGGGSTARVQSSNEPTARTGSARDITAVSPVAGAEETAPESESVIAAILAERRRGDYPEVELWESGFTITERVRIGGQARADYDSALRLLGQERYNEGIAVLRGVTEAAPDATAPYIDLGIAYSRIGDLEQAEQAFRTADLLSPNNPIVQNELGILYRRTGRFAEARTSYENALAVYQDFHFARRNLAVLCDLYLADLECALQNYQTYLDSVGSDAEVEIWVADITNRLGN